MWLVRTALGAIFAALTPIALELEGADAVSGNGQHCRVTRAAKRNE
jgi:hypothetical protein